LIISFSTALTELNWILTGVIIKVVDRRGHLDQILGNASATEDEVAEDGDLLRMITISPDSRDGKVTNTVTPAIITISNNFTAVAAGALDHLDSDTTSLPKM